MSAHMIIAQRFHNIVRICHRFLPGDNVEAVKFLFGPSSANELANTAMVVAVKHETTVVRAIEEFCRFIALKGFTRDDNATIISPTILMDELWHGTILEISFYRELQTALGLQLDHRPSGATREEGNARSARLTAMKALYIAFFEEEPIEPADGEAGNQSARHIEIFTKSGGDQLEDSRLSSNYNIEKESSIRLVFGLRSYALDVELLDVIFKVKSKIQDKEGVLPDVQLLLFDAFELEDSRTLKDYGIVQDSTLHLIMTIRGCYITQMKHHSLQIGGYSGENGEMAL